MPDIIPFHVLRDKPLEPAPKFINPHQPPGWQRIQAASILAIHAAEDRLASVGIPRAEARAVARASIQTFLQNMEMNKPTASIGTVQQTVEDFLHVCEVANENNGGKAS